MIRALVLALVASACAKSPIVWEEPRPNWGVADIGQDPARGPAFPGMCANSVRFAADDSTGFYSVWWSVKPDSTADVVLSHSTDGTVWEPPVRLDTLDAGRRGCRRAPPSIASTTGNVHVAYGMDAREGPGVFTAHWMTGMAHAPVAVVYGEKHGHTSIAARGDTVVVAYEDPNTEPRRVGLAFSRTGAHLYQWRELVSPPTGGIAWAPVVLLSSGEVLVSWQRGLGDTGESFTRRGRFQ